MTTSVLGRSPPPVGNALHLVDDLEPLHDLAEQRVLRRELDTRLPRDDEELAAVRVGPGVGHRHRTDLVLAGLRQLVGEPVPGAAPTAAVRIATLAHEAVDDAVEDDAVVVVVEGEEHEVVDRCRRLHCVERDHEVAHRRAHRRGVALVGVDPHLGRLGELLTFGRGTVERRERGGHGRPPYRSECCEISCGRRSRR